MTRIDVLHILVRSKEEGEEWQGEAFFPCQHPESFLPIWIRDCISGMFRSMPCKVKLDIGAKLDIDVQAYTVEGQIAVNVHKLAETRYNDDPDWWRWIKICRPGESQGKAGKNGQV